MVICHCLTINDKAITALATTASVSVDDVAARCGAGARCGGCRHTIESILAGVRADAEQAAVGEVPSPA